MLPHFYFVIFFLTISFQGLLYGQSQNETPVKPPSFKTTFYYDANWELTSQAKSFYRREAFFDFTELVFDGVYKDFNNDNVLIAEGSYSHGVKGGLQSEYFGNRRLRSTIEYSGDDFTIWEFRDQEKKDSIKNGSGKFTIPYFYLAGLVTKPSWRQGVLTGEFSFGKKSGTWIYEDLGNKKTDEEYYVNGKLTKRIHFTDPTTIELDYKKDIIISVNSLFTETLAYDKTTYDYLNQFFEQRPTYPVSFQRPVAYPGGLKRLLLLLSQNAEIPAGQVCIVKLKLDEHGRVLKYSMEESVDPATDNRAVQTIKLHEKRFLPAIKNGMPYAYTIYLPVSGGQYWVDYLKNTPIEDLLLMR